jgi:hypothetical protein
MSCIDVKTFLLGGEIWIDNNPYRSRTVEGFDVFRQIDYIADYRTFKHTVAEFLELFGWSTADEMSVDSCNADIVFEMPSDDILYTWQQEQLISYMCAQL